MSRGAGSPFDNVVRFGEAVELRQTQRAAIPLQRGEAARLALPTGFKSEEAQLALDIGIRVATLHIPFVVQWVMRLRRCI